MQAGSKKAHSKFHATGVTERTYEQMRRVLLVAQILEAEGAWLSSYDVHRMYVARVGDACEQTIRRDLQLLACTGLVEVKWVEGLLGKEKSVFKFDSWPLPLG